MFYIFGHVSGTQNCLKANKLEAYEVIEVNFLFKKPQA